MKCFAVFVVIAIVAGVQCQGEQKAPAMDSKMRQMSADQMRQMANEQMRKDQMQNNENMVGSAYGANKMTSNSQTFGIPTGVNSASTGIAATGAYGAQFSAPLPSMASNWAPSPPAAQQFASVPAPPCPRNYLFSCQPNLTPAPCSQVNGSPFASAGTPFASAGAYSHYMPQYALPPLGLGY